MKSYKKIETTHSEKKVPFLAFFSELSRAPPIRREIWVVPVALTYSAPLIKGVILPVINLESY